MTPQDIKLFGDEIELAYGYSLPAHSRESGNVPVFGSNGQVGWHNHASVDGPGIVIGRKGSVGKVTYSPAQFCPIDTTYYVVNKNNHHWKYLYYTLQHARLTTLNSHSTIPGLNREDVYALSAYFPIKSKQKSIADALSLVETCLEHEDSSIKLAQKFKHATMHKLFTCGLRGEPQKETEIGLVPESWDVRSIIELCEIWSGGTPRKSVTSFWSGSIPWASGKDLKSSVLVDTIDHITEEGLDNGSRLAPEGAVLVLVRGMGLAKDLPVAVLSHPMAFNQDIKALITTSGYSGAFLRSAIYFGKERLLSQCVTSAHGTKTLNLNDIEQFLVPCLNSPEESEEIVDILNAIDQKIDLHRRKKAVLEELFKSLLHKLMTGEIHVDDLDLFALEHSHAIAREFV